MTRILTLTWILRFAEYGDFIHYFAWLISIRFHMVSKFGLKIRKPLSAWNDNRLSHDEQRTTVTIIQNNRHVKTKAASFGERTADEGLASSSSAGEDLTAEIIRRKRAQTEKRRLKGKTELAKINTTQLSTMKTTEVVAPCYSTAARLEGTLWLASFIWALYQFQSKDTMIIDPSIIWSMLSFFPSNR